MVTPNSAGTRFASLEDSSNHSYRERQMATRTARKTSPRSRGGKSATKGDVRRGSNGNSRNGGGLREAELKRVRSHPKPPMPKQHQEYPGLEAKLNPKPRYSA